MVNEVWDRNEMQKTVKLIPITINSENERKPATRLDPVGIHCKHYVM